MNCARARAVIARSATAQVERQVADHDRSAAASVEDPAVRPRPETGDSRSGTGLRRGGTPATGPADKRTQHAQNPSRRSRGPLYAALDLGTNNCRLLIARPHENSLRVLDGCTRSVRLGEGLSTTGRLSDEAMDRTIDALRQCRNKLREHEPARARLIATEACRSATNGQEFLERVERELGLVLEIVDRQTEAALAVTGCADLIEEGASGALMFDIGGGSSELAWLDFRGGRPKRQGRMSPRSARQSLPVGVVSIAEKFGGVEVTRTFRRWSPVSQHLRHPRAGEAAPDDRQHRYLIGTSGTVTTLASLHLGLGSVRAPEGRRAVDDGAQVDDTMSALLGMPYERQWRIRASAAPGNLVLPAAPSSRRSAANGRRRGYRCDRGLREAS